LHFSPGPHWQTTSLSGLTKSQFSTAEKATPYNDVTHYNNYYEFGTRKDQPASLAQRLKTSPWTVKVEGAVNKPDIFDIEGSMKMAPLEERIYRHRCVEAWSIVVPWIGFPLNVLIKKVEPTGKAKFVAFETVLDRGVMLSEGAAGIPLPYVEGLRIDEAMHPRQFSVWACTAKRCRNKTARRYGW
jgi:sulfoxide reductase catalytic subunit YedY